MEEKIPPADRGKSAIKAILAVYICSINYLDASLLVVNETMEEFGRIFDQFVAFRRVSRLCSMCLPTAERMSKSGCKALIWICIHSLMYPAKSKDCMPCTPARRPRCSARDQTRRSKRWRPRVDTTGLHRVCHSTIARYSKAVTHRIRFSGLLSGHANIYSLVCACPPCHIVICCHPVPRDHFASCTTSQSLYHPVGTGGLKLPESHLQSKVERVNSCWTFRVD